MKRIRVTLHGAHAVITGGARGIGLATARRLAAEGAAISLWDRDAGALEAARGELTATGARVHTAVCDITRDDERGAALAASRAALGPITILINNAGHVAPGAFHDQPGEVWRTTLRVNVEALILLTRDVIDEMYGQGVGHIVNISSAAGTLGVPDLAVYSASKWAVRGFSEALRAESARRGVAVTAIHPSYIAVGMFAGARVRGIGSLLVPLVRDHDVIARAIVEAGLKRGRTVVMRPRGVHLAVLFRGLLPDRAFNWLMRVLGAWESMRGFRGQ